MGLLKKLFAPTPESPRTVVTTIRDRGERPYNPAPPSLAVDALWTSSSPALRPEGRMRVVGESYRQEELREVLAKAPRRLVLAQLVRDRANPHHAGAVAVFVGHSHVGYLGRDDLEAGGQAIYKALARLERAGRPATCWGLLNGGVTGKPSLGIHLLTGGYDRPDEPFAFPVTVPPDSFATVLGTESHQDLLRSTLGDREEILVSAALYLADANPSRPAGGGPVLVATVADQPIGALSVKESTARTPLIEDLTAAGFPANALARIRRSTGKSGGYICSVSTVVPATN